MSCPLETLHLYMVQEFGFLAVPNRPGCSFVHRSEYRTQHLQLKDVQPACCKIALLKINSRIRTIPSCSDNRFIQLKFSVPVWTLGDFITGEQSSLHSCSQYALDLIHLVIVSWKSSTQIREFMNHFKTASVHYNSLIQTICMWCKSLTGDISMTKWRT